MSNERASLNSTKMRDKPVGKLLFAMSVPAILSMLVQALYNVVDTIFVSKYAGEDGIMALSLAFPLQLLVIAFGIGIGVGANAQIAKKLGEGKKDEASKFAVTGLIIAVITGIVFGVIGLTLSRPFLNAFSAPNAVKDMGTIYLTVVISFSMFSMVEITTSKILQATGNMKVPMISQLIGAIINIILDPLLIFGIGFFPEMGVLGAAVATVVGQGVSMCFVLIVVFVKSHDVSVSPKGFRFKKVYVMGICAIGIPVMVMNAVASVTTTAMNAILAPYSEGVGVSVLGVYFKIQSFVFMPVFGLTQGLMPILSYNYGSGDKKRFNHALRLGLITAVIIMVLGLALFQFGTPLIMRLFNAQGEFLTQGIYALRIISICFIPAAFGIVLTTTVQSLGRGVLSLFMSLLRQIVIILPVALLFAVLWGLNGVWFCYPIAEFIVVMLFLPMALHTVNKKFDDLKKSGEQIQQEEIIEIVKQTQE